jgi:glutamate racemase
LIEQDRKDELEVYLKNLLGGYRGKIQNVVLGCTHYPLVKKEISKILGDVKFFDGADGVSRRVKYLLAQSKSLNTQEEKGYVEFTDSSADELTRKLKEERFYKLLDEE